MFTNSLVVGAVSYQAVQHNVDNLVGKFCEAAFVVCIVECLGPVLVAHSALHQHKVVHHFVQGRQTYL